MNRSCLILTLTGKTVEEMEAQWDSCGAFCGGAELRLDYLLPEEDAAAVRFSRDFEAVLILTCRLPGDGGRFSGSEEERRARMTRLIREGRWDYADLEETLEAPELSSVLAEKGIREIRSFHDFTGLPGDLESRIRKIAEGGALPKAAVTLNTGADLAAFGRAARALEDQEKVLLGMGTVGRPTRILAGVLGSLFSFTSVDGAAPGHLKPREMEELYGFSGINPETRVFGIVGHPLGHTMSPALHNPALRARGIDGVYVPFDLEDPEPLLRDAEGWNLRGLSVTVPHKERVIALCDEVEDGVRGIGACNTLVRRGDGWFGFNTDAPGFWAPLDGSVSPGARAYVIGAGGAARAVVRTLAARGLGVTVFNRTLSRAEPLGEEFGVGVRDLSALAEAEPCDLIVQTSSAGMHPLEAVDPSVGYEFSGDEIAYDLIYNPGETAFLQRARQAGCRTLNGYEMLLCQGERQFELFTGRSARFPGHKERL